MQFFLSFLHDTIIIYAVNYIFSLISNMICAILNLKVVLADSHNCNSFIYSLLNLSSYMWYLNLQLALSIIVQLSNHSWYSRSEQNLVTSVCPTCTLSWWRRIKIKGWCKHNESAVWHIRCSRHAVFNCMQEINKWKIGVDAETETAICLCGLWLMINEA